MTVDELRTALEGVPGELEVQMYCDQTLAEVDVAHVARLDRNSRMKLGEPLSPRGTPFFAVGDKYPDKSKPTDC
jgi:hypothetical protein